MAVTHETVHMAALMAVNLIRKDMGAPPIGALIPGRKHSPTANPIALSLRFAPYSCVVRLDRELITMYHGYDPFTGTVAKDYQMKPGLIEFLRLHNTGQYPNLVNQNNWMGEW